ncbi:MAG: stage II sporulation protein M [Armatimonadetes bacterium]|nr:stage II sporulation protein M [Armatimonadota bacterium]
MQNTIPNDMDSFKRLEDLLERIEKHGLRSLNSEEVLKFGPLYRRAVSALSVARSQGVDDARIQYLNGLVSRAYGHVYVAAPKGWPSLRKFFTIEFPQSFRRNLQFILVSLLISLIGAFFAWGVVARDVGKADVVFGAGATNTIDEIAARHEGNKNWMPEEARPIMSSYIITNNIKVAAGAFALGITAGIGTIIILFYNGLMLGVVGAGVASRGTHVAMGFWSFVAPHGIIELPAIFIAGGAGLLLAWAILNPGQRTRSAALKLAGREAFKLMLGVAAMLLVAGIIEGFVSPSMLPNIIKLIIGAMIGAAEFSYLFFAGRKASRA